MSFADAGRSRRLTLLLAEFGLPNDADASALQVRYRTLAKQRHPDMVATDRRARATADFAKMHSRYQEALALLEKPSRLSSADSDHIIRTHNGLFYHDPYKWAPSKPGGPKLKHEMHQVPASWMTKMKGVAVVGSSMALALYVFDRTARKRSLSFWNT
ncbi:unnamed protein product [Symbiodinium natans]|uniref:J domain-containing protein n=1 Tax=Symbiodinium natans TaxID=878477 RepID=A0A812S7N8_9DINO|nr:unnamed protein product [Symbiodinium natans]